jgi:ubiquitin carboxyl-terminal hydrolase 5/13
MSAAKCEDCDLTANLWMNMHDGHLGCGRKNWDGSGANNHAVDHGEKFGRPLVCKMGTITPEGKASIYCYKCDDDVLDTKLGEHMHRLGVKIADQVKTEKTMAELNLEANLNMTLSKVLEEGKELIP